MNRSGNADSEYLSDGLAESLIYRLSQLPRVYLSLGDKDQSLEWLEKDFQSRNATMPNFLTMSPFDLLHDDPRFKDLVRRIGLQELK